MKKKLVALLLAVTVLVGAIVGGTLAYLSDTDSAVNVATVGNVKIAQHQLQRADGVTYNNDGKELAEGQLVPYVQGKKLYPAYAANGLNTDYTAGQTEAECLKWGTYVGVNGESAGSWNGLWDEAKLTGAIDSFVFVENTGKSDAYYRTWVALECPTDAEYSQGPDKDFMVNVNGSQVYFEYEEIGYATIDGQRYYVFVMNYTKKLAPKEISRPSLLQVVMTHHADNALSDALGETYEILAFTEAVQVENMPNYETALDAAFGDATVDNLPWDGKIEMPLLVNSEAAFKQALEKGMNPIVLVDNIDLSENLTVGYSVTIDGSGYTLGRADGYTGTLFSVGGNATLTMKDVTVDGGAAWSGEVDATLLRGTVNNGVKATGNLIATEGNGSIVLDAGTILQNNDGSHAVSLATRGGGSLTLNGAQIINNSSDSGAIWGGGAIIVNGGSKINGNSSTGAAGVIRMVSSCNMTVTGGEINHNKAATDGGVIWGYGSSTYTFTGGEMAYNEAGGVGGAIYTGNYSVIKISGDFSLHNNKADINGAIRLTDHTSMDMTDGEIYENTQNSGDSIGTWNNSISITGGYVADDISYVGGLWMTVGEADIDGVIHFDLSTNHNTAYLAAKFNEFKFTVNEDDEHFGNFNFKPADDYTYTAGDEAKLICENEGYSTYWDAATGTFRLRQEDDSSTEGGDSTGGGTQDTPESWTEVNADNLSSIDFTVDNGYYWFVGDFNDDITISIPAGQSINIYGSNATFAEGTTLTVNAPGVAHAYSSLNEERRGDVTIKEFKVETLNVLAYNNESVGIYSNTVNSMSVVGGNFNLIIDDNTVDGNFETYIDGENQSNEYGISLRITDYELSMINNTITDTYSHSIGINGRQADESDWRSGGTNNVITAFSGNEITVNSTEKTERAALKIWNDQVYAPYGTSGQTPNTKAYGLMDTIKSDTTNVFTIDEGHHTFDIYGSAH